MPHTSQHVPLSSVGVVSGTTPGAAGSSPTQVNVERLKSVRDDLNSLLQEASPAESHRLRKIIGDLNAGIPVSVT